MGRQLAWIALLALAAAHAPAQRVLPDTPAEIAPADRRAATPAPSPEPAPPDAPGAPHASRPAQEALPLGRPADPLIDTDAPAEAADSPSLMGSAVRTIGALGLVVALIFGLKLVLTGAARSMPGGASLRSQLGAAGRAPSGLLLVLGRYPVAKGQTLVLLQLDRRVLLLAQTAAGFSTLAEITEPTDVASILAKARDEEGASHSARFNSILSALSRDPDTADPSDIRVGFADAGPDHIEQDPDGTLGSIESGDAIQSRLAGIRSRLAGLGGAGEAGGGRS